MNRDKLVELKKFLEDEIKRRKKEVEYLEFLLAYVEGTLGKASPDEGKVVEESLMEVRAGKETIAIISRTPTGIKARLLFEAKKTPELISEIRKQVNMIDENAKISFFDDREALREIAVESKYMTPVTESGISEALKLILVDIFREGKRSEGKEAFEE